LSYRLQTGEELSQGVPRIAFEQINEALTYLQTPGDDLDKAVHETRKCFKKLRGLLRLIRQEIGETVYHRENICFRDAGRLLSDLRDSAVMIQTSDDLIETSDEVIDDEAFGSMREALVIFYHTTRQRVVEEDLALVEAADMVQAARRRVAQWPVDDESFTAVAGGLRKIYKRGRNRLNDARVSPVTEAFHEWRKRVKYLWYSTRILRLIWSKPMAVFADEIHDLANCLGDMHDLAQLQTLVAERPLLLNDDTVRTIFNSLIDRQREKLRVDVFRQGQRIYPEQPDAFVDRIGAYWESRH
jgi:CHAD domain-containing protein